MEKLLELSGIVLRTDIGRSIIGFLPRDKELRNRMRSQLDIGVSIRPFEHIIERW